MSITYQAKGNNSCTSETIIANFILYLIFLSYDILPLLFGRMNADVFSHGRIQRGGGGTGLTSDFLRNSGTDHP